jgi:hypothetical protein
MNYTLTRPISWKMPSSFISANLSVELKDGSGALIGPEKHQRTSDCPVLANDRFAPEAAGREAFGQNLRPHPKRQNLPASV